MVHAKVLPPPYSTIFIGLTWKRSRMTYTFNMGYGELELVQRKKETILTASTLYLSLFRDSHSTCNIPIDSQTFTCQNV